MGNNYSHAVAEPDDEVVHVIPNSAVQPSSRVELVEPELVSSPVAEHAQAQREVKLIYDAHQGLRLFAQNAPSSALLMQTADREQVLLNPEVFRLARHYLSYKPSADMFASATHHQLPRYYSKDAADMASAWVDAFSLTGNLNLPRISIRHGV